MSPFRFLPVILFAVRARTDDDRVERIQYSIPIPIDLPTRNERAEQCYLRIEDVNITETLSIYCHIAHSFLRYHIREYNFKQQAIDGVEVTPWAEDAYQGLESESDHELPEIVQKNAKDWRMATVLDPITRTRLYVTQKADCRVVMYNREATSNYRVSCDKVLYFINSGSGDGASAGHASSVVIIWVSVLAVWFFNVLI